MMSLFVRRRRVWVRAAPATAGVRSSRWRGWRGPRPRAARASTDEVRELTEQIGTERTTSDDETTGPAVTSEALAHLSNNLLYSAMAVYAVAMYCYAAELAFGTAAAVGRSPSSRARELVAVGAAPAYDDAGRPTDVADEDAQPGWATAEPARPGGGVADGAGVRAARGGGADPRAVGRPAAVGQHVRVLHHRRAGGDRGLPGAADPQGRPLPRHLRHPAGAADARASRWRCSTPSRRSWCRR